MPGPVRRPLGSPLRRAVGSLARTVGWPLLLLPLIVGATVFVLVDPHFRLSMATPRTTPSAVVHQSSADSVVGADAAACLANQSPQLVLVSISRQRAWMCAGTRTVHATAVTTGDVLSGDGTPTGTWAIEAKQPDRWLSGPGYSDFVHYWMPFHDDFGFHDADWQTMPFGDVGYRSEGSHGCVHLPEAAMSWLYNWAEVGAGVTIVQ
ncbi:L,D-transpeptidase [Speluncibacter jeojiensis]|uniref:L,D-transpeptidase n=1 Tax=Speluncibacter jeojiensis TaxID=2710754 RepID=UPI002410164F|nr:L,D-transpeptidase [Rhodococcus sp. D2-41]